MQCFPLYSILMAVGNPTVDLFSLDIEGAEFQVLKTVPWDKVDIKVILVEVAHLGKVFDGDLREFNSFMSKIGYDFYKSVKVDSIYVKKDFQRP
jgi:predicted metallopeptidase